MKSFPFTEGKEYELTGCDYLTKVGPRGYDGDEEGNGIKFTLNGKHYMAIENPDDGYRSTMESFEETTEPCKNTFPVCRVVAHEVGGDHELLQLLDADTNKVVLEVGTNYADDWYPSYIGDFAPEHMKANQTIAEKEKELAKEFTKKEKLANRDDKPANDDAGD